MIMRICGKRCYDSGTRMSAPVPKLSIGFNEERRPHGERKATEVFQKTIERLPDGRYQVGLLWKNRIPMPRNYHEAQRMFYALEKQMEKDPQMRINFNQTVNEWLNKQICLLCSAFSVAILYSHVHGNTHG